MVATSSATFKTRHGAAERFAGPAVLLVTPLRARQASVPSQNVTEGMQIPSSRYKAEADRSGQRFIPKSVIPKLIFELLAAFCHALP